MDKTRLTAIADKLAEREAGNSIFLTDSDRDLRFVLTHVKALEQQIDRLMEAGEVLSQVTNAIQKDLDAALAAPQ